MQEAKYLWHWRQLYISEIQKQDAIKFVEGTLQHQVIEAWRKITEKSIRAKAFKKNVVMRNQMSFVFQAWSHIIAKKKELKKLHAKMEKMHEHNVKTIFMFDWI
jgi:hypothetical protein